MSDSPVVFPISIANSSIEFALMGPIGRHRGVIVKSEQLSSDLIAYDNPYINLFSEQGESTSFGNSSIRDMLDNIMSKSNIYVVRSPGASVPGTSQRNSHFSFVWRGLCNLRDRERFERHFTDLSYDLNEAIKSNEPSEIEWMMSGLIAPCMTMQKRAIAKRRTYYLLVITYIIIILIGIIASSSRFIFK